jgi:DNA-binding response OmpR family regulator
LVEDEVSLARFVEVELITEGYHVSVAHDVIAGLTLARVSSYDLAILDWMLPGLSGVELCRRLRGTGSKLPIILLTAKDEVSDRVAGLNAGADDYVVKPFSVGELLARIRAHLRRPCEPDPDFLQFEDLSLDRRTREIFRSQRSIELTAKEFDLLEYLLNHPRQVLTRDQILAKVWGLVVQKSPEHLGMRSAVVERGIVWDAQVPKSKANPCHPPCSIVNCIPN